MNAPAHVSLAGYYRLVRHNANFRRLWTAQIISQLGDWFYSLAIYDLVYRLTGSAHLIGLAVLLQILPMFVLGPTAGAVNDRLSRKNVMIAADLVRAVVVFGMVAVQTRDQLWLLYVLLAMEVGGAAFFEPGRSAVIPIIVGPQEVLTANSLSAATWSFNLAVGAGIGGLAVYTLGERAVFLINSLSFLASAVFLARMRFSEPHLEGRTRLKWSDVLGVSPIIEGIRYVKGDLRLAATLFLKCGLGLVGGNLVLLPVMGESEFHLAGAGVLGMSALFMSRGVGAAIGPFAGGWIAGARPERLRMGVLIGFCLLGTAYWLLSRAPTLALACACLIGGHAGGSMVLGLLHNPAPSQHGRPLPGPGFRSRLRLEPARGIYVGLQLRVGDGPWRATPDNGSLAGIHHVRARSTLAAGSQALAPQ